MGNLLKIIKCNGHCALRQTHPFSHSLQTLRVPKDLLILSPWSLQGKRHCCCITEMLLGAKQKKTQGMKMRKGSPTLSHTTLCRLHAEECLKGPVASSGQALQQPKTSLRISESGCTPGSLALAISIIFIPIFPKPGLIQKYYSIRL